MHLKKATTMFAAAAIALTAITAALQADHHGGDNEGFTSIFDGRTLTGWKGDLRYWSVKDGAITATTEEGKLLRYNTFLIWNEQQVANFELRLKYKIVGGNSGIQYRSRVVEDERYVVSGYQADIDSSPVYSGIMYEERARGILAQRGTAVEIQPNGNKNVVETFGDATALQSKINNEDWNDYTIIADGNTMTHIINGQIMSKTIDNQENAGSSRGVLALQAHQGPPMQVQFKDIMIKNLD